MKISLLSSVALLAALSANQAVWADGWEGKYFAPRAYICTQATSPITIDGKLDDAAWAAAPWTQEFANIEGADKTAPTNQTQAKLLWDADYLYIAAQLEEPHITASITEHDAVIFHDNDFEVFLDPDSDSHNYGEFEMNALNTGWDLFLNKPYKNGGDADNSWEIEGLRTAVFVDGTLNDASDTDHGWSVEIAIPWKALSKLGVAAQAPAEGTQWRMGFSRVEWDYDIEAGRYEKIPDRPEHNWVWSPQGVINMHRPETWGYVQFTSQPADKVEFARPAEERDCHLLHQAHYAAAAWFELHQSWPKSLAELGLDLPLEMEGTPQGPRFKKGDLTLEPDARVVRKK